MMYDKCFADATSRLRDERRYRVFSDLERINDKGGLRSQFTHVIDVAPTILEVALDHGFSSAATFARAFRAHFGMSATEWRRGGAERWRARRRRKMGKQLRKPGKDFFRVFP